MSTHGRSAMLALLALGLSVGAGIAGEVPASMRRLIENRCIGCHDGEVKKGGLDLSTLPADMSNPAVFAAWVKVHDRVRAGEMPPPKREQPAATEREPALKDLAKLLTDADSNRQREQGRVALRRLNRTEYENTMRDLFSLPGLQVKELLPEDGRYDGFDKASDSLDLSAVQLRKYIEAADVVLDAAIAHQERPLLWKQRLRQIGGLASFGEAIFPINNGKVDFAFLNEMRLRRQAGKLMGLLERKPHLDNCQSLGMLTGARPAFNPRVGNFSPFHSGFYRIRTSVWCYHHDAQYEGELKPTDRSQSLALTADGRLLAHFDAPSLTPRVQEIVVWLNAGETLELNPANLWRNFQNAFGYVGPALAIDYVDVEGPLHDTWPPASHQRLFGNLPLAKLPLAKPSGKKGQSPAESYPRLPPPPQRFPGARPNHTDGLEMNKNQPVWTAASPRPAEDAARLLNEFLPRAFRRPVPPEEVDVYVEIARSRLAAGDYFETAMRTAYRTALCSPDFLFLQETTGGGKDPARLDHYAIVSRLSYFLWNSMPDDELLALAENPQLPAKTLSAQIDRMLKDPKSDRFIEDFLDQWLDLRKIDATSPDAKLYPEFRPDLRDAMLAETRAFFRTMLTDDIGAAAIVDSDFLTINQRLAEHYGISGVDGSHIRRVPRPEGSPYGGLLTQASVLKVTANGTSTSPVLRGAWVTNRILGKPPQPPPPDVPAVDPDIRGTVTIREQLDKHRNNAACAGCHAKLDPPGFALESFDVIGAWRSRYRFVGEKVEDPSEREGYDPSKERFLGVGEKQWEFVQNNVRLGLSVDASGATVEGQAFKDIYEYKRLLLADEEALARNLVQRLILYSTGAPVGFADRAAVDAILKKSKLSGYGVRTLIREIIQNPTIFQRK